MKIFINFFSIIIIVFFSTFSYSENSIVYINMNKIMNETRAGKSINEQLEKMHKQNIKTFKITEKELKEEEATIISQKNILSKDDYLKKINTLRSKANTYRKNRQSKIDELTKKRISASSQLLEIINPILSNYSETNEIAIILPKKNLILAKKNLDITDKIIEIVNSKVTKINLK
ncbi:OmpH family outer membrane protein [Candidatus Pelagibacter sp.]|nr:OmpH family outer membrane protein [Candidatus Pelagibacter sp.]